MNTSGITGLTMHNVDGDNEYVKNILMSVIPGVSTITLTTQGSPYAGSCTFTVNSVTAGTNDVTFSVNLTSSDPGAVQPPAGHYIYVWIEDGVTLGAQGAQGYKGHTGATGDAQGAQGAQGVQGYTGPTGYKGANNEAVRGPQGATGAVGPRGPANGAPADTGLQGYNGFAGPTGAAGNRGPQGVTGAAGPRGPQGRTGAAGPNGADAPLSMYTNSAAPYANVNHSPYTGQGPLMDSQGGFFHIMGGIVYPMQ